MPVRSLSSQPIPSFEQPPNILIVEAPYYTEVADQLRQGATAALQAAGCTVSIIQVPGALEIPTAILYALKSHAFDVLKRRYDGYVALGCVLKGETRHHEVVGDCSAQGLQELAFRYALAVGNGILTCDTLEQALARANVSGQNRGGEVALATLQMIKLKEHFNLRASRRRWEPYR